MSICYRSACDYTKDDSKMNTVYQSHFAHSINKSLDVTMSAISKSQQKLSALLDSDSQLLAAVNENQEKLNNSAIQSIGRNLIYTIDCLLL